MGGKSKADISKITPPAQPPPENPDKNSAEETKDLESVKKGKGSPLADSYNSHLDTLCERIRYHEGQIAELRIEKLDLQNAVVAERNHSEKLAIRCASLESATVTIGFMNLAGSLMTILGSVLLGIAGAVPDLMTDKVKHFMGGSGATFAICGGIVLVAGYLIGWVYKPSESFTGRDIQGHDS